MSVSAEKLILIVDDSKVNRTLLKEHVKRLGHIPVLAEDGPAALESVENQKPDIILLDLMMPGMDGYEVLERLKAKAETSKIPVIVVTAVEEQDSAVRCVNLGADDYMIKPFKPDLLKARINALLERVGIQEKQARLDEMLSSSFIKVRNAEQEAESKRLGTLRELDEQLARVAGFLTVLERHYGEASFSPEKAAVDLDRLRRSVEEMARLVQGRLGETPAEDPPRE